MYKKQLHTKHLLYMILLLIVMIGFAFLLNLPIYIGILISIAYIFFVALSHNYTLNELLVVSKNSFNTVKIVISMLLLISATLPIWMVSGTLPTLIHYSFTYLSHLNIPLSAFLISSLLSLMLGTFIGTLSILGPLFMSLAIGLSIPLPIVAGALISGAVLGDRLSPISSNFHLICASCQAKINETFVTLLKTNGPAFVIASIIYYVLGSPYQLTTKGRATIDSLLILLDTHFSIHIILLLPILLLLVLIMSKKVSTILSFLMSYVMSIIIYIAVGLPILKIPSLSLSGFHSPIQTISTLINGSGIYSMIAVPFIILCSAYLNDLLNHTKLIDHALNAFSENISSNTELYHKTALLSIIVTVISCNQSLTAIITGQHFQKHFNKRSQNTSLLARTIADTGSIIITIIPWNLNALVAASITGVSTLQYTPYAIYVIFPIVMTFLLPYVQSSNKKEVTNKAT